MRQRGVSMCMHCLSRSQLSFCPRSWRSGSFGRSPAIEAQERRKSMIRWFLRRQIAAFERTWNYDASYMHEVIDVDLRAMLAFGGGTAVRQARADRTIFRHARGADVSHAEI